MFTPKDLAKFDESVVDTLLTNTSFCTEEDALEILEQLEREYNSKGLSALSTPTYNRSTIVNEEVEAIFKNLCEESGFIPDFSITVDKLAEPTSSRTSHVFEPANQ